jgi:hypothetical protein
MGQPFDEVVAGAHEAVQDMIEPEKWAVTLRMVPGDEGYRLLVTFNGERLKTVVPGRLDSAPSPRVAVRNWVGHYLDSVVRDRGVSGRRTLDDE